jgi:2-amino-4-hydroxy-6-hydroxymethyldihydropteridine diphosphokinase
MTCIYLGLGSNLDSPLENLRSARAAIADETRICEIAFSNFYQSPPMAGMNQPDYINAVMAIETDLTALELLATMQKIENQHGRIRSQRWGARTLDIDILLFGDEILDLPDLKIPHYGMAERAFVLQPLFEIAPDLEIPTLGNIAELVARCPLNGLERVADAK